MKYIEIFIVCVALVTLLVMYVAKDSETTQLKAQVEMCQKEDGK